MFKIPTTLDTVAEDWVGRNTGVQAEMGRTVGRGSELELSDSMQEKEDVTPEHEAEDLDNHDMISRINKSPLRSDADPNQTQTVTDGTGAPVTHSLQMVSVSAANEFRISHQKDQLNSKLGVNTSEQGKSAGISSGGMPKASAQSLSGKDVLRGSLSAKSDLQKPPPGVGQPKARKPIGIPASNYALQRPSPKKLKNMFRTGTGPLTDHARALTPVGSDGEPGRNEAGLLGRSAQNVSSHE